MALPLSEMSTDEHKMNVVLKRDVTELLATEAAFNRTMLLAITGAVFLIVLILFWFSALFSLAFSSPSRFCRN